LAYIKSANNAACTKSPSVTSVRDGVVSYAGGGDNLGYGGLVVVNHVSPIDSDCYQLIYAHLQARNVKTGQTVKAGQSVGVGGGAPTDPDHGSSDGPHLHFETRRCTRTASGALNMNKYGLFTEYNSKGQSVAKPVGTKKSAYEFLPSEVNSVGKCSSVANTAIRGKAK
jgi:murein DD-endopeptidase MepM/ murein hydrolase activator NlpD